MKTLQQWDNESMVKLINFFKNSKQTVEENFRNNIRIYIGTGRKYEKNTGKLRHCDYR